MKIRNQTSFRRWFLVCVNKVNIEGLSHRNQATKVKKTKKNKV